MSFKANLRQKILIDRLAAKVSRSLRVSDGVKRVDKDAMRELLQMAGYKSMTERDLEIYRRDFQADKDDMLVLDNELVVYHTTLKDVLVRKSPLIKEMVNIFNMVKILNDSDVAVSKGRSTIERIHSECLNDLDLTYTESDIEEIAEDGRTALKNETADQLEAVLDLFAEILSFEPPPVPIRLPGIKILGRVHRDGEGVIMYGPVLTFYRQENSLKFFDHHLAPEEMKKTQAYLDMVGGKVSATLEGGDIFGELKKRVMKEKPPLVA